MDNLSNKKDFLRKNAEDWLTDNPIQDISPRSAEEQMQELQVHQIELEMQNESLRQVQLALEESRNLYFNLYVFAPVSYITLSKTGHITEINLAGAALLGEDRKKLVRCRFDKYVLLDDHDQWHRYFVQALEHDGKQSCELRGKRGDGSTFEVYLDSLLIKVVGSEPKLHIMLTDITEKKKSEKARRQFEMCINKLTRREREVLALALSGTINKDISIQLKISQRTVENYRSRIHIKTGVISLLELAHQAVNAGVSLTEIVTAHDSFQI